MLADFLKDVVAEPVAGSNTFKTVQNGAEYFHQTWLLCEQRKSSVPPNFPWEKYSFSGQFGASAVAARARPKHATSMRNPVGALPLTAAGSQTGDFRLARSTASAPHATWRTLRLIVILYRLDHSLSMGSIASQVAFWFVSVRNVRIDHQ